MDLMCTFHLWVTIDNIYLDVLKPFLLGFGKFWVHIPPCTLCGTVVFTALVAGIFQGTVLQAADWARVSALARHYFFSTYIITMDWHQDCIQ